MKKNIILEQQNVERLVVNVENPKRDGLLSLAYENCPPLNTWNWVGTFKDQTKEVLRFDRKDGSGANFMTNEGGKLIHYKSKYVSEGSLDLTGPKYIYLVIDDYNNNVNNGFFSAFNSSILNKNILARLSVKSNIQNNLSLITADRQYFGPVDIKKMQIQLLDEFGRPVDTHHMDYSFCLRFNTIYDL